MSNKIVEYKDLIAFHPGQYVSELIEDYNVTQKEFAERYSSALTSLLIVFAETPKRSANSFCVTL